MADVRMPDGQIIANVPDNISQDELLKMYSGHLAANTPAEASVMDAMKKGFSQAISPENLDQLAKDVGPVAAGRMAGTARFLTGAAELPANLLKITGISSKPAEYVQNIDEAAKRFQEQAGSKSMLPAAANIAGNLAVAGPALKGAAMVAEPVAGALPVLKPVVQAAQASPAGQAILGGAALGAAGSTGEPIDMAKQAGLGGLFGGAGHAAASGIGAVLSPALKRFKELQARGITAEDLKDTTMGQFFGGNLQKLENAIFENVPLGGVPGAIKTGEEKLTNLQNANKDLIQGQTKTANTGLDVSADLAKTAQKRAMEDAHRALDKSTEAEIAAKKLKLGDEEGAFHRQSIERALEPLGIKPEDIKHLSGTDLMNYAQKAISQSYENTLPQIKGIRVTGNKEKELRDLTDKYNSNYLGDTYHQTLQNDIDRLVDTTNKGGWINSQKWQGELSDLGSEAQRILTNPNATTFERRYGMALRDLKDSWMDLIEGKAGSEAFKNTNTAFSRLQAPQKAAAYVKSITEGGEFSPQQLLTAIKSGLSTKRFAGGEDELQQMATKGHQDMMARRAAHKQEVEDLKDRVARIKETEARNLQDAHAQMERNVKGQKDYLGTLADKQIESYKNAIENVKGDSSRSYEAKRLGYGLTGMGGAGYGLHAALGVSPLGLVGLGGGLIGGTKLLYTPAVQRAIQRAALMERPDIAVKVGEQLKRAAPAIGITAAEQRTGQAPEEEPTPQGGLQ